MSWWQSCSLTSVRRALVAGVLIAVAVDAGAQGTARSTDEELDARVDDAVQLVGNGPSDSKVETPRDLVEFTAAKDGGEAVVKYSRKGNRYGQGILENPLLVQGGTLGWTAWSVAFSTPFDEKEGESKLATLDGLSNTRKLKLEYSTFFFRRKAVSPEAVLAKISELDRLASEKNEKVAQSWSTSYVEELLGEEEAEKWLNFFVGRLLHNAGIEAEVARKTFKFSEADLTTNSSETEYPWSVSAYYSVLTRRGYLFTAGYSYQDVFKEADKLMICTPATVPGALQCTEKVVGGPTSDPRQLAYLAMRRKYDEYGLEVRAGYDLEANDFEASVPIYFLADAEGGFTGGLKLGWSESDDEFVASVFVGKVFKIL